MAEIELSALYNNASTVVSPTEATLKREIAAWNISAIQSQRLLLGAFLSLMRARISNASTHHFQRDKVLGPCEFTRVAYLHIENTTTGDFHPDIVRLLRYGRGAA